MNNEIANEKGNKLTDLLKKIGRRNVIIAIAALVICAAVAVNLIIFANADDKDGFDGYENGSGSTETGGNQQTSGDQNQTIKDDTDSYFASTQISRERARDEAMEVLQSVIDNAASDEATKAAAMADLTQLAKDMEAEANIETLITAKGFAQCVAVINDSSATIVVKCEDTLTPAQLAQINEIVYTQSGILPASTNIIEK